MELPKIGGKRQYIRLSLHSYNYYEALMKIGLLQDMGKDIITETNISKLLDWTITSVPSATVSNIFDEATTKYNNLDKVFMAIERLLPKLSGDMVQKIHKIITQMPKAEWTEQEWAAHNSLMGKVDLILEKMALLNPQFAPPTPRKISEILGTMISKYNGCKPDKDRKYSAVKRMVESVGISLDDDYSKVNDQAVINQMAQNVIERTDIKGDGKRKYIGYIKEFVTCANGIDPDNYKLNIISNLPNIPKTKKSERKPHWPYTDEQLLEIFNPKYKFFQENVDVFWSCMIAMFTGARRNAAVTLQYGDIKTIDGIPCINFQSNHDIKFLKNEASERIVPINPQLIKLGFVDFVNRRRTKTKATDSDFIFPKCRTKSGKFNIKFLRKFFEYLKDVGIKQADGDRMDFHSFRKNASVGMQNAGIQTTYINDIIGWDGNGTMEQSYSNHSLKQIKTENDKFSYKFLQPHFDKWNKILIQKS
jgi:integrase